MPIIIPKDNEDLWLDPSVEDKEQLLSPLKPYPADEMEVWEVSPRMNRPGYDSPENIKLI
jgi:putative SOS response-associated peptidase YedK